MSACSPTQLRLSRAAGAAPEEAVATWEETGADEYHAYGGPLSS